MSIGVPFHSIAAAAFMNRPRSRARGKSICGSIRARSFAKASTSVWQ
jgi:hypothetical protein